MSRSYILYTYKFYPHLLHLQPQLNQAILPWYLRKNKFQSWHFDSACSRHLTSEKSVFVGRPIESSTKIECANSNYLTTKGVRKIKLSCLKEDGLASSITINDVLYVSEAKANLLSLGQLSERGVDMRTIGAKIYLHRGEKTVMTRSKIRQVWLMNSITWLVRAMSAREVVLKALKKDKNDILHERLGHKQISHMVDGVMKQARNRLTWSRHLIAARDSAKTPQSSRLLTDQTRAECKANSCLEPSRNLCIESVGLYRTTIVVEGMASWTQQCWPSPV